MTWVGKQLDNIGGLLDFSAPQPQVPAPQSRGFLGGQVDPRMLMDLGMGILAANKPSLAPTNLGSTIAGGYDYMRNQQNTRADQDYKNAMSQAAMAKANKYDLKSSGEEALALKLSGATLTPKQEADLKAYDLSRTSEVGSRWNPETMQPESYQKYNSVIPQILGAGRTGTSPAVAAPASQPSLVPPPPQIQSNVPAIDGAVPAMPISSQEQAGQPIVTPQETVPFDMARATAADQTLQMPNVPAGLTPKAQQQIQTQGIIDVNKINAKSVAEEQAALKKEKKTAQQGSDQYTSIVRNIDDALGTINRTDFSTGLMGAGLQYVPGSAASALQNALLPIKAKMTKDELSKMRAESPTGGAVGQVTEGEWGMLASAYGSLDAIDRPEQLVPTLMAIKSSLTNIEQAKQFRALGINDDVAAQALTGDMGALSQIVAQTNQPFYYVMKDDTGLVTGFKRITPENVRAAYGQ